MHEQSGKKRGCLFYGCLTLAILAVITVLVGYVAYRYTVRAAQNWAAQYTDTSPTPPPAIPLTSAQVKTLHQRVDAFRAALKQPTNTMELVLTADEINALLRDQWAGRTNTPQLSVQIEGDQLTGNVSIPLSDFGPLKLQGRYLNGLAGLNLELKDRQLTVRIRDLAVKGKALPGAVLAELRRRNLAEDVQSDPDTAKEIAKFESIALRDGRLILRTVGPSEAGAPNAKAPAQAP